MENRAFNMDCMEAMRSMPDQCFDLAVVDPPYGIKISNNMGRRKGEKRSEYKKVTWDDAPPPKEYFTELARVSKNQIIFGANHFVSMIQAADSSCWICWDKGFSSEVSFASFELAWTSFETPCKRVALSSAQAGRIHPTQKPVALYAWIFQHYAKPGDRILDTHLGSGSSRIARGTPDWILSDTRLTRSISRNRKSGSSSTPRNCPCSAGGGVLITILIFSAATPKGRVK